MDLSKTFRTPHSESECRKRISQKYCSVNSEKKIETPGNRIGYIVQFMVSCSSLTRLFKAVAK